MEKTKNRKTTRLEQVDYNRAGAYFITVCTKERRCLLSQIVGTGVPDGPFVELLPHGQIVKKYIDQLSDFYNDVLSVEQYVIMPNHVHMLLFIKPKDDDSLKNELSSQNGPSRTVQCSMIIYR